MIKESGQKHRVFVITGASGTGKTTVASYLVKHFHMHQVVTHTTRKPRPGEVDGVDYYFESPVSIKQRHLLESVTYDGHLYGSSEEGLAAGWQAGQDDVIVLETVGAARYHQLFGDRCVVIYLTVSPAVSLGDRMQQRGESLARIKARQNSVEDRRDRTCPPSIVDFAHVIINDNWQRTRDELDQLVERVQDV